MANQEAHSYPITRRSEQEIHRGPAPNYGDDSRRSRPVDPRIGSRWVWVSVIAVIVFFAVYVAAVRTYLGQYLEDAALLGAKSISTTELDDSLDQLRVISVASLVVMLFVYAVIGFVRKAWDIAIAGMAILGVASVAAELFKRVILQRPDLAGLDEPGAHNSFPSGHTTIAMAILLSLIVVVGYRWRGWVVGFAMIWASSVGAATVTARWHRFSDTLGADALALFVAALVALWLLRRGSISVSEPKTYPLRAIYVALAALLMVGTFIVGFVILFKTLDNFDVFTALATARQQGVSPQLTAHLDPVFNQNMFYAAQSLALAFSTGAALWFWGTFHRIQTKG